MDSRFASRFSTRSCARWTVLLPLVLVGSMLFWTVAFGLGALSLLAATGGLATDGLSTGDSFVPELTAPAAEPMPGHVEPMPGHVEPITVHIEESAEPEDVNDNAGAVEPLGADEGGLPEGERGGNDAPPPRSRPTPATQVIFTF